MKAWIATDYGEPQDVLRLVRCEAPVTRPRQVLVQVEAIGLNFADALMVNGRYQVRPPLPFIPGFEIAGILLQPTADGRLRKGDRAMAQIPWGAFAQIAAVDEARLLPVPPQLSTKEAAAFPVSFITAHIALVDRARIGPGEWVIVHAAGGALGQAMIQIAGIQGATVIAVAGSQEKIRAAHDVGAHHSINRVEEDWVSAATRLRPAGVEVVVDSVGGSATIDSLKVLNWRGRLLLVGFASGDVSSIPANRLLVRSLSAIGVFWSYERDGDLLRVTHERLLGLLYADRVRPRIGADYSFAALPKAVGDVSHGQIVGKAVVVLD
jgi:NADPH2:quinone reductase